MAAPRKDQPKLRIPLKNRKSARTKGDAGKVITFSPRRRFANLIRSISQPDTKVVLSLGGGGIRMYAHLPVLEFIENLGASQYISEVWGASGGALIGLLYSRGLSPEQIFQYSNDYFFRKTRVSLTPSLFSIVKNIALETLFSSNSDKNIKGFHNIQDAMTEVVEKVIEGGKVRFPIYCLAYNLETNQTDVLTPDPLPERVYPNFIFPTNALDAIVASSSVPILFVPKVIEDDYGRRVYADGATGEEVPTVSVYKKWLRDRELGLESRKRLLVIAVDLHPDLSHLGFLENWLIRRIPAFQYILMTIHLTDLIRKARVLEQKRNLINDPNVELWELDFDMKGGGLMNVESIPRVRMYAQESIPKQFEKINDSLLG